MSFTSLTSHVILLMLVSWMGAELLASGNRMIRRVFGKLSVLLGMYALTCLLIAVWFLVVFSTAGNLDPRCRGYDPWGSRTLRGVSTGGVESFVVFP